MKDKYSVFQIGSRMHYAVPEMMHEMGMLEMLYTDIVGGKGLTKMFDLMPKSKLPTSLKKLTQRRPNIPSEKLVHFPKFGLEIGLKLKNSSSLEENLRVYNWYNKEFQRRAIKKISNPPEKIYSFNGASLEIYKKYTSSFKVLEQTIAPFKTERKLLEPEFSKLSNWSLGQLNYNSDASREFGEREFEEMMLADKIICASNFVKDSMLDLGVSKNKISVVPYGVNLDFFQRRKGYREKVEGKLKILTVGRIGVRKGAHLVLEMAKRLKDIAEFTMVGPIEVSEEALGQMTEFVNVVSSVTKEKLLDFYEDSDVFFLPSLCEGSATVVYEALAMGLPCVVSHNTGSIITSGTAGYVTRFDDLDEIEDRLSSLLDNELRNKLSKEAIILSKQGSLSAYFNRLSKEL